MKKIEHIIARPPIRSVGNQPKKTSLTGWLVLLLWWGLPAVAAAVTVGSLAPDFSLSDQNGQTRRLSDYRGQWVILYFYPKDDTPGCTTEGKSFRDNLKDFQQAGAQVLGVSMDSVKSHRQFAQKYGLNFPLLADESGQVARLYGAAGGFGPISYAKRQTFLIDPDGAVVKHYQSVSPSRHVAELKHDLAAAQKLYRSLPGQKKPHD